MEEPFKCPFCGATRSVSKGVRKTKTMGGRRIRLCKACGRKFTPKNQEPGEIAPQGVEKQASSSSEQQDPGEAAHEADAPTEPAGALAKMFPPPDEQWTS